MNLFGSPPNHENRTVYEETPLQGLFRGTAGRESFFKFLVTNPPRGRPFGKGGNHRTWWGGNNLHIVAE